MNKRLFPLSILTMALVCGGLSSHAFAYKENKEIDTPQYADPNLVAYAASYSDSISGEPNYTTQRNKTFQYLDLGDTLNYYRGDKIKVGIIDSGINYDHEEFMVNSSTKVKGSSKYYKNTSGNYWAIYDVATHGYSYIDDNLGHGTNVAATVAAAVNGVGGLGLAPNVELYVYKVTNDSDNFRYQFGAIQMALTDAVTLGLDVVNMSFQSYEHAVSYGSQSMNASPGCSSVLTHAWDGSKYINYLKNAYDAGITFVAAAGNFNTDEPSYPASNDYVISVGSLNQNGTDKAGFSNYGSGIDLVAPGYVNAADIENNSDYEDVSGTSFSAPLVTAAIALYKQKHPSATPAQIESALYASCDTIDDSGSQYTNWAGNGSLNVANFLGVTTTSPQEINWTNVEDDYLEMEVGDTFQLQCEVLPSTAINKTVHYQVIDGDEDALTVTDSGLITAIGEGEVMIEVYSDEDTSISNYVMVNITAKSRYLSSISVKTAPTKVSYIEGNTFDPTGLVITAHYSDDTNEDIAYSGHESDFYFSPSTTTSLTTGHTSVTITYNSKSTTQAISVVSKSVTSLTLGSKKTSYYVGDSFVKPTVTANYDNGTSATVTNNAVFTGNDLSTAGNKTVTVSYGGCSTTYQITVTAVVATSIAASGQKTTFNLGDTFSFGGTVTATYNNGSHSDVTSSTTFSGYNMNAAGQYTVTAKYLELTTEYTITVNPSISYTLVDANNKVENGDKVVVKTSAGLGVSGYNNNKDATTSDTESDWVQFTVGSATSSGWTLYDSSASKYIASPGGNEFKYGTTGGTCSVDGDGHLICNDRYLCKNGTNYRFYTSIGSYTAFLVYKVTTQDKAISNITVKTAPTKVSYIEGNTFDPTNLVITVTYSDSTSADVDYNSHSSDFSFVPDLETELTTEYTSVTITYFDHDTTQTISVKSLSSISISEQTTSFIEGDEFTFGGAVTANYSDGSHANVTSEALFSGYNMTTLGNQTVTVSYGGINTTYSITVNQGTLESIEISGYTTVYITNTSFSFDGTCTAHFANGYQKDVTPTSVTSPDMSTIGNKNITVSFTYNGKTKTQSYNIEVQDAVIQVGTEIKDHNPIVPYMSEYSVGDNVKVYKVMSDGERILVTPASTNYEVDTSVLGEHEITATFGGFTGSAIVKVTNQGADDNVGVDSSETEEGSISHTIGSSDLPTGITCNSTQSSIEMSGYARGGQWGSKAVSITFSGFDSSYTIKGIDVVASTNTGSQSLSISIGGSAFDASKSIASGTANANKTYSFSGNQSGGTISITSTSPGSKTIWVKSVTINYELETSVTYPASPEEQAIAWATYFNSFTSEYCDVSGVNTDVSGLSSIWQEVDDEYGYMTVESKSALLTSSDENVLKAIRVYTIIVSRYQLEDFIKDSNNQSIVPKNIASILLNISNNNGLIVIISSVLLLSLSVGSYLYLRKKKEQ